MSLTFLDFFAGVGGFRKGMEMAGHKCLGHCEIDKFANMSYKAIHEPKEDEWFETDIRKANADELPRSDVWCFGFPCQDISIAGKQLGFKGQRSSLFFTVTRLIRDTKEENRPKYLFIENVKNLLSVNGGTDFLKLLIELDEIGYDAEWENINSKDFGVPQNRERVFIIGHLREGSGRKVFPIGGSYKTIKDESRIIINRESKCSKTYSNSIHIVGTTKPETRSIGQRDVVYGTDGIIGTLTATDYKQPKQILIKENTKKCYGETYEGDGNKISVRAVLTPDRVNKRQNGRRFKEDGEPMFTLTAQDRHGVAIKEATNSLVQGALDGYRIRKLTPKECWRLQGWDDESFEKAASVCSNSQLYKQAGNGVTVNVIYEIAKRLE